MPEETLTLLFSHIDPLYELHASFLKVVLLLLSFPFPSQLPLLLPHILFIAIAIAAGIAIIVAIVIAK